MRTLAYLFLSGLVATPAYGQPTEAVPPVAANSLPPADTVPPSQTGKKASPTLTGLQLAVGIGYGVGFGGVISSTPDGLPQDQPTLDDAISAILPLEISLGYRPIPSLSIGVALVHAPMFLADCGEYGCSASDERIGAELRWHMMPAGRLSPWASVGFGYEWFEYVRNPGHDSLDVVRARGYDLDFQLGGEYRLKGFLTVGPYVGLRFGTFAHFHTQCAWRSCPDAGTDYNISGSNSATHGWLTVGLRGAFTVRPW